MKPKYTLKVKFKERLLFYKVNNIIGVAWDAFGSRVFGKLRFYSFLIRKDEDEAASVFPLFNGSIKQYSDTGSIMSNCDASIKAAHMWSCLDEGKASPKRRFL